MKLWIEIDQDLAARVKKMVEGALAAARYVETALEVTHQAMQWADQLIEGFESLKPLPRPVACQPGCSFCCTSLVEATPAEVFLIAQVISRYFPPAKLEPVKERTLRMAALKVGKSKEELAAARQVQPCPLLEEERCVIYPWRPLMCRAMHSLDREHCRTSFAAGDLSGEEYYLHRYVFPMSISAGLKEGFGSLGCQMPVLDLTRALGQVLLEPWVVDHWLKGEEVFQDFSA
ncbi:MAG: YkgJ family cysteine cluster protein [Syntrophobacterales bacterium]|jgi:Fe-S-cluster containining protein